MKISSSDFAKSIEQWAEQELCNKGSAIQKGLSTFLVLQFKPKIESALTAFQFLADESGLFELEILQENLGKALAKIGGTYTIPLINYVFDQADLDVIFKFAKEHA